MILSSLIETYDKAIILEGSESSELQGICKSESLKTQHLCYLKDAKFLGQALSSLESTDASQLGFVVESTIKGKFLEQIKPYKGRISFVVEVASVDEALCRFSKPFYLKKNKDYVQTRNNILKVKQNSGELNLEICDDVFIGDNVRLGKNIIIHSGVKIMANVEIGDDTIIYPNAVIYPFTKIGHSCRIHSQASIGADGFGYNFINGQHMKIWHFGGVDIGDFVEIGAGSCIDSGSFQPTIIGNGCKIDNLVQVGHNAKLGEHVVLCGQVAIGGSAKIDDFCALGGKAAVGPGAHIGMASQLAGGALAVGQWQPKSKLAGYPAFEANKWLRSVSKFKQLGERKRSNDKGA